MSPNFFIVGGSKCGTTNISYYLNLHPKIFFSELNEPYYFCKWDVPEEYNRNSMITNMKKYLDLFKNVKNEKSNNSGRGPSVLSASWRRFYKYCSCCKRAASYRQKKPRR